MAARLGSNNFNLMKGEGEVSCTKIRRNFLGIRKFFSNRENLFKFGDFLAII